MKTINVFRFFLFSRSFYCSAFECSTVGIIPDHTWSSSLSHVLASRRWTPGAKAHKNTRDTTKPHRCVSRWLELGYAVCRPNNRHMPHAEKRRKQLTGSQEDIEKGPPAKNKTHGGQKDQLEARFIFFCPCPFKSKQLGAAGPSQNFSNTSRRLTN